MYILYMTSKIQVILTQIQFFHKLVYLCTERSKLFFMFHITCKNTGMDSEYISLQLNSVLLQSNGNTNIPQKTYIMLK